MITISLCMIVKNEEKVLTRCLESIKDIVDEIIIVDTGSSDNTKKSLTVIHKTCMTLNGFKTFLQPEIILFQKQLKIIKCG